MVFQMRFKSKKKSSLAHRNFEIEKNLGFRPKNENFNRILFLGSGVIFMFIGSDLTIFLFGSKLSALCVYSLDIWLSLEGWFSDCSVDWFSLILENWVDSEVEGEEIGSRFIRFLTGTFSISSVSESDEWATLVNFRMTASIFELRRAISKLQF